MMKLNQVVTEFIEAASAAALTTAVNAFIVSAGEATLIQMQYQQSGTVYSVMIVYAK